MWVFFKVNMLMNIFCIKLFYFFDFVLSLGVCKLYCFFLFFVIGIGEFLVYNILLYICMLNIDLELLFLNISIIKKYVYENVYILIELKFMFLKINFLFLVVECW